MSRDRRHDRFAERRRRHPRVHKRTIIELHLEVLNECEATDWENVKDDYLQIVVQQFAQDLMRDDDRNNNILGVSTSNHGLSGSNASSTLDPPIDSAPYPCPVDEDGPWSCMESIQLETDPCPPNDADPDPWSCMETIQLATDPCAPNDCDPWSCMETIQFDAHHSRAHSHPGDATSECTQWINWIDRSKHILRECTTQPWFLQLKADWKQYLRQHMAANEDNVVSGQREF
ncbi:hypothetical protein AK88_05689, partial [Plasmodium fragile]